MYLDIFVWPDLERISDGLDKQDRGGKLEGSSYGREFKNVTRERTDMPGYLKDDCKKIKNETATIARYIMVGESRACEYWRKK